MSPRERVQTILEFREADAVPFQVDFTVPAHQKMAAFYGDPGFNSRIGNHLAQTGHHRPSAPAQLPPGHWQDEFGVIWNRTVDRDIGVVANCLLPEPRLEGYAFPDPGEKGIFDHVPAFIAENRERFRVGGIGFSLFERAWTMRGMENLLADMYDHPAFVEELLDAIAEYNLALIDRMLEFDLDAIRFGDDWGCQRGVIMGPPLWRRFIKPRLARMYGRVRAGGRKVMIHCCGCVEELFDDLIEIGLNIFNPFQPEVMDTLAVKRKYGDRLAFYGGISIQRLLPYGTPDEIERKVKRLLGELGRRGGYIAAPAHGLPGDIPAENIHAMLEVFWEQAGVEPLAPPV